MNIQFIARIDNIFPSEIFGASFETRKFWVTELEGKYPNSFELQMQQGDCNVLDGFAPGDVVELKVEVKGRAWSKNGKSGVMNTLKCFYIFRKGAAKPVPSTRNQTGGIPNRVTENAAGKYRNDDSWKVQDQHPDRWQDPKSKNADDDSDPF